MVTITESVRSGIYDHPMMCMVLIRLEVPRTTRKKSASNRALAGCAGPLLVIAILCAILSALVRNPVLLILVLCAGGGVLWYRIGKRRGLQRQAEAQEAARVRRWQAMEAPRAAQWQEMQELRAWQCCRIAPYMAMSPPEFEDALGVRVPGTSHACEIIGLGFARVQKIAESAESRKGKR